MPEFLPVLRVDELPQPGMMKAVEVKGQKILIGRIGDQIVACLDRCPHAGAPLHLGKLAVEELTCFRHGWTFHLPTGQSIPDNPAFQLTQVPVRIEGSHVFVSVG